MKTRTSIAIDSNSQYGRQRLAVLILVSVAVHGGILLLFGPGPDSLPEPESTIYQAMQIHLTPNSRGLPEKQTSKELPEKALNAWQLIERSLDPTRSQIMKEADRPPYHTFGNIVPDSHLDSLVTTVKPPAAIETYRPFSGGNIRVKMVSMFGGFQCFEIRSPNPLDAFSAGVWLLAPC